MKRKKHNSLTIILIISAILLLAALIALFVFFILPSGKDVLHPQPVTEKVHVLAITPTPTAVPTEVPSPTPSPSDTPVPTAVPTPKGLLGGRFDVFSDADEPVMTEETYRSKNVSITVTKYSEHPYKKSRLVYFVADIYLQDISSLRTAAGKGFDRVGTKLIVPFSRDVNALVAINGDFYTAESKTTYVLRNGVLYRPKTFHHRDVLILYTDGSMETLDGETFDPSMEIKDAWQIWQFGPNLIDADGNPVETFKYYGFTGNNPRTAIGYYEPGHYCFVIADGRQSGYSMGMTLPDLAHLMKDLGCTIAYNMDGGASSQMYWNDKVWNKPSGGSLRSLPDIIYITEPVYDVEQKSTPIPIGYKGVIPTPAATPDV